jgi:hypothetical protein
VFSFSSIRLWTSMKSSLDPQVSLVTKAVSTALQPQAQCTSLSLGGPQSTHTWWHLCFLKPITSSNFSVGFSTDFVHPLVLGTLPPFPVPVVYFLVSLFSGFSFSVQFCFFFMAQSVFS